MDNQLSKFSKNRPVQQVTFIPTVKQRMFSKTSTTVNRHSRVIQTVFTKTSEVGPVRR